MSKLQIDANWNGPYGWPGMNQDLPALPAMPGVYLLTIDFDGGYLIYAAGITRRPLQKRFREHTRAYLSGIYNVLDINAMQRGVRKEIWHGFWTRERLPDKKREYLRRKIEINKAVCNQLRGFRIFAANIGTQPRLMERLEAAIMNILYEQPSPFSNIPDKGMMLMPRWKSESPIIVTSKSTVTLHGLPRRFEI